MNQEVPKIERKVSEEERRRLIENAGSIIKNRITLAWEAGESREEIQKEVAMEVDTLLNTIGPDRA